MANVISYNEIKKSIKKCICSGNEEMKHYKGKSANALVAYCSRLLANTYVVVKLFIKQLETYTIHNIERKHTDVFTERKYIFHNFMCLVPLASILMRWYFINFACSGLAYFSNLCR
jgi:hypothetical protein